MAEKGFKEIDEKMTKNGRKIDEKKPKTVEKLRIKGQKRSNNNWRKNAKNCLKIVDERPKTI